MRADNFGTTFHRKAVHRNPSYWRKQSAHKQRKTSGGNRKRHSYSPKKRIHGAPLSERTYRDAPNISSASGRNLTKLAIKSDGMCLFRAFRVGMASVFGSDRERLHTIAFGEDSETQRLREQVVNRVLDIWHEIVMDSIAVKSLVEWDYGTETKQAYKEYMSRPDSWGGQAEMIALGDLFKTNVVVIYEDGRIHSPKLLNRNFSAVVHIWFNGTNHFQAMV